MGLGEYALGLGQIIAGAHCCALGIEEFVFGVEHVEQAALADVELLTVGIAGFLGGKLVLLEVPAAP
jgi:hypothetical protein